MTWVLWDILVPLLLSFGLGALFGWIAWGRGLFGRGVEQPVEADAAIAEHATPMDEQRLSFEEHETANIVLIQERDSALNELDEQRAQSDVLQLKLDELESASQLNLSADIDTDNAVIDNPIEAAKIAAQSQQQSEQVVELEQKLEQVTVACQEERKAKREVELDLLNTKNQCEKLEALNLSMTEADSADTPEFDEPGADALRTEFEALEVNHAKLQADLEEQKRTVVTAHQSTEEKDREIDELKTSIITLQSSTTEPAKIIERHQQEISEQNEKIENLEKQIAQESLQAAEPVQLVRSGALQSVSLQAGLNETAPSAPSKLMQKSAAVASPKVKAEVEKKATVKSTSSGYVPTSWTVPETRPAKKERDNLTDIKGVGPVLEKLLHEAGIFYFRQVALLDKSGINELQQQIPQFPDRIRRDQWVKQAKKLHQVKFGEAAKELA